MKADMPLSKVRTQVKYLGSSRLECQVRVVAAAANLLVKSLSTEI